MEGTGLLRQQSFPARQRAWSPSTSFRIEH
jgi:hypothetical protein